MAESLECFADVLFTFLIVNIKPNVEYAIYVHEGTFTFLIVNIKLYSSCKMQLLIKNLHSS